MYFLMLEDASEENVIAWIFLKILNDSPLVLSVLKESFNVWVQIDWESQNSGMRVLNIVCKGKVVDPHCEQDKVLIYMLLSPLEEHLFPAVLICSITAPLDASHHHNQLLTRLIHNTLSKEVSTVIHFLYEVCDIFSV